MKNAVLKIASVAAVLARFLFIAFWKHQKQRRKLIEGTGITFWRYLRQRDFVGVTSAIVTDYLWEGLFPTVIRKLVVY